MKNLHVVSVCKDLREDNSPSIIYVMHQTLSCKQSYRLQQHGEHTTEKIRKCDLFVKKNCSVNPVWVDVSLNTN